MYATYSEGFRPGGVNRAGDLPPYQADYLKNYEIGWKTTWAENHVRFNGAFFLEDWNNFQFAFLGPNGLTRIANAGAARVTGVESQLQWAAGGGLSLSAGLTLLDPHLTKNYCGAINPDGSPITDCPSATVPNAGRSRRPGRSCPGTSKVKGNLIARYDFPLGRFTSYAQGSFVYQSAEWDDLRLDSARADRAAADASACSTWRSALRSLSGGKAGEKAKDQQFRKGMGIGSQETHRCCQQRSGDDHRTVSETVYQPARRDRDLAMLPKNEMPSRHSWQHRS